MINALTRSRSPEFHRATMLRLTVGALLLWLLWEPIRPVRTVTADLLYTAGDLIRR
jgi:threonine/homoserine efflux transporter RhtA